MNGLFQPAEDNANFRYWAKLAKWTEAEASAIILGLNPDRAPRRRLIDSTISDRDFGEYESLVRLATSASWAGRLKGSTPSDWIRWAIEFDIPVPPELAEAVAKYAGSKEDLGTTRSVKLSDDPRPRERESMLKLIIGMAVAGYRFDPKLKRSDSVPEIVNDLEKLGVPLDPDTVRKYLREGAELLPPEQNRDR